MYGWVFLQFTWNYHNIVCYFGITQYKIKLETVTDFIFLGPQITADADCSHEIKRHFLLGRKVMTYLDNIFKSEILLCQQRFK